MTAYTRQVDTHELERRGESLLDERASSSRWKAVLDNSGVLFVTSIILTLLAWYAAIAVFDLKPYIIPPPHEVASRMVTSWQILIREGWVTLREIAAGFGLATLVGLPLGVLVAFSTVADRLLYPPLIVSQAVPKIALAPVFLAWFGFGFQTNVAIGSLIAVFPIIINTTLGLRALDPEMVRLGRAMGAPTWRVFVKIRLPSALPSIFAGLKIGITFAVIGAIIGEFVAGSAGLGYTIAVATGNLTMDLAFAAIVTISLLGVATFFAIELLERIVLRTHPAAQGRDARR